eukprot:COSAG05_NODE_14046_length_409_cov_365.667742_1_plen_90_part_00
MRACMKNEKYPKILISLSACRSNRRYRPLSERVAETFGAAASLPELKELLAAQAERSPWAEACMGSLQAAPECFIDWVGRLARAVVATR